MMLCNDDILKMDAVTKLNINETLTYISYIKDRNNVKDWVEAITKLDDKKAYSWASRKAKARSREFDTRKTLDEFETWFRESVNKYN